MPVSEPWPLEAIFGVLLLWSGLIGLFLLGVHALTRLPRAYVLAGFFHILTRVSFVALLTTLVWKLMQPSQSFSDWTYFAFRIPIGVMAALMALAEVIILAQRVLTNKYGTKSAPTTP